MRAFMVTISIGAALLLTACAGSESPAGYRNTSPTAALLRGDIATDQYLHAVRDANVEANASAQFEVNREPTRAFNTRSERFEFVPDGTVQKWNPLTQRWEFTPPAK
jgi:hypothetical protein